MESFLKKRQLHSGQASPQQQPEEEEEWLLPPIPHGMEFLVDRCTNDNRTVGVVVGEQIHLQLEPDWSFEPFPDQVEWLEMVGRAKAVQRIAEGRKMIERQHRLKASKGHSLDLDRMVRRCKDCWPEVA